VEKGKGSDQRMNPEIENIFGSKDLVRQNVKGKNNFGTGMRDEAQSGHGRMDIMSQSGRKRVSPGLAGLI